MPKESASAKTLTERSPATQARARLDAAMARLKTVIEQRIEAAEIAATSSTPAMQAGDDSEQWQNACKMLESQAAALRDENARLQGDTHQARERYRTLAAKSQALLGLLDQTIGQVESLIKEN